MSEAAEAIKRPNANWEEADLEQRPALKINEPGGYLTLPGPRSTVGTGLAEWCSQTPSDAYGSTYQGVFAEQCCSDHARESLLEN